MKVHNKLTQDNLTPKLAHDILVEGNERFVNNLNANRNFQQQVMETSIGQYPFAVILSCIDSRVPAELVFDQGIGDIFSTRVAGNIINDDLLGSMEYACKVAGSKIVVVMGHTKCGAVTAACNHIELGHITTLLEKIKPAVSAFEKQGEKMSDETIELVSEENVKRSIKRIRLESKILFEMKENGEIEIIGAIYDVSNGEVRFLD